jgi:hypothetical protein
MVSRSVYGGIRRRRRIRGRGDIGKKAGSWVGDKLEDWIVPKVLPRLRRLVGMRRKRRMRGRGPIGSAIGSWLGNKAGDLVGKLFGRARLRGGNVWFGPGGIQKPGYGPGGINPLPLMGMRRRRRRMSGRGPIGAAIGSALGNMLGFKRKRRSALGRRAVTYVGGVRRSRSRYA